jgi:polar amino acid transport system substrate-binding protein
LIGAECVVEMARERTMRFADGLLVAALLMAGDAMADDAVHKELTPTGKLRVAIAVGPSPSALFTVRDVGGRPRGVPVTLGLALAKKLGVPVEFVEYLASGEITENADKGIWDVTFMPYDAERAKKADAGAAYHVLQSTYLVAPKSKIRNLAEVDRSGVRVAGVDNTATFRAARASLKSATLVAVPGVDAALEMMRAGEADAIALSRESLSGLVAKLPGARILDGGFLNSVTAVWVPKGKPAALAYVSEFVEEAKASGLVRRAFDDIGLKDAIVAPAGR